ncbi:hypothetical protein [Dyadobacter pollutisoli]|uniref:Uncharacterized protein n=1 Tax=Dyadobacter pollutisoli TaxID=2910158 RepID=A0A9E8N868_9BACT|nr:hypothetical protein [Dyadobacter pollutisoli]WAC10311.1 hypothetical protein ON006_21455 [Dyadobacter pollutisoli]
MKDHKGMRPQDIVVLLAIVALQRGGWDRKGLKSVHRLPFPLNKTIAELLNISTAEISASLYRSAYAGLITDIAYSKNVLLKSTLEFLRFGLKYVFPVQPGALVRGIPTAHSADPLKNQLSFQEEIVWEHADGTVRGQAILPLYNTVPEIVTKNKLLYELLALTDSLRIGGARERELAIIELEKRFFQ